MGFVDAAAATEEEDDLVPLRNWIEDDAADNSAAAMESQSILDMQHQSRPNETKRRWKESMIRKATVAYGIVELLVRCPDNDVALDDEAMICIDNFAVFCKKGGIRSSSQQQQRSSSWTDVKGVSMISSGMSLSIEEPSYMSFLFEEEGGEKDEEQLGRYLEVELDAAKAKTPVATKTDDCCGSADDREIISKDRCHILVAKILHELFTHEAFSDDDNHNGDNEEPAYKKAKTAQLERGKNGSDGCNIHIPAIGRMQQLDVPASICRMVQNLLESPLEGGGDAYKSLGEVGEDLHLLLFDPDRFMFDHEARDTDDMQLLYRQEKLYGRDKEEILITDTFCRVTRGKSEAFFIGGFSGSGKSMLVDTLRVKVKDAGGYVIKHKFDAISQDRPLSGVISAVNQLCLKIKDRLTSHRLTALSNKLKDEFGADIGLLARMLPNVCALSPEFSSLASKAEVGSTSDNMNSQSVSFTLLRFIRLVSSPKRPITVSH